MKIADFLNGEKGKFVVGLGFFDSVHKGHFSLISDVVKRAEELSQKGAPVKSAVFTFSNNLLEFFSDKKQIYTFQERLKILEKTGVDTVIAAKMSEDMKDWSGKKFMDTLTGGFDVVEFFAGSDYTYGQGGKADILQLKAYCAERGIRLNVIDFVGIDDAGEDLKYAKISSSEIRKLIEMGEVGKVNRLLSAPYFMSGTVEHCIGRGKTLNFPTANLKLNKDKLKLANGVYVTRTVAEGKTFPSITNVGGRPTFDRHEPTVETYILGFDGDIYGRGITVQFLKRLRDVKKFENADAFLKQLKADVEEAKAFHGLK